VAAQHRVPGGVEVAAHHWVPLGLCETCHTAAAGGYLEVLKWLHITGCPWDSGTCSAAAKGGYLEMLWARAHGCPWSKQDCDFASAVHDHPETLAWVRAQPAE
jgi:hypothetical protein